MLMSGPAAPNIHYSISSDQYLLSAMNTLLSKWMDASYHAFLDSEIKYRLSKFSKILRLNKKMTIWASNQQLWMT